jgi:hypothetical protein
VKLAHLIAAAGVALLSCMLVACQPRAAETTAGRAGAAMPEAAAASAAAPESGGGKAPRNLSLALSGYNYTDRYIDTYEVNGQGGGNLRLSSPGSAGGSVCCVSWLEGSKLPQTVEIKWAAAYCIQRRTNSDGETRDWREPILHIADVEFAGPVPANPAYFEVHFFPDGHIEVAITEKPSPPRLSLEVTADGTRPGKTRNDPPCAPDYERIKAFNQPVRVNANKR